MQSKFSNTAATKICPDLPEKKPRKIYGRIPVPDNSKDLIHRFLRVNHPQELADLLNTNLDTLADVLTHPRYTTFHIPKKSGGVRTIHAPEKKLKWIQKVLSVYLNYYYSLLTPPPAQEFIKCAYQVDAPRDIVSNAQKHVGKKVVLNIDLKHFFENILIGRVYQFFLSPLFHFNSDTAKVLTLLTTYQKRLPAGAPTSPVISNFICLAMDRELENFCHSHRITYTRYADDLTFSSDEDINELTMQRIFELIDQNGFTINPQKVRKQYDTQQQMVTGLVVNEKPNIVRKKMKIVRAMLYDWRTYNAELATMRHFKLKSFPQKEEVRKFIRRLRGLIAHIGHVRGFDDPLYLKYLHEFEDTQTTY